MNTDTPTRDEAETMFYEQRLHAEQCRRTSTGLTEWNFAINEHLPCLTEEERTELAQDAPHMPFQEFTNKWHMVHIYGGQRAGDVLVRRFQFRWGIFADK